jgi:hypothetical protein
VRSEKDEEAEERRTEGEDNETRRGSKTKAKKDV